MYYQRFKFNIQNKTADDFLILKQLQNNTFPKCRDLIVNMYCCFKSYIHKLIKISQMICLIVWLGTFSA